MLYRTLLVPAIAVLAGSGVMAQDLSALPTCAQSCAISGISSTGCGITDLKCICSAQAFLTSVGTCTTAACSAADLQSMFLFHLLPYCVFEAVVRFPDRSGSLGKRFRRERGRSCFHGIHEETKANDFPITETYAFAQSLCGSVGVTLNIPGQQQPPASSPASTPAATTPATTAYSTTTTLAKVPYPTGNATTTVAPSGSAPTSPPFQGAASGLQVGSWLGGLAAVAGFVLAL
ncbi:MAG: hypothetical protein M1839_003615 [Geoglossum umbratile]|nr:MAG: hypothetical protein M1839_003615 [Geoglossum umbratile]